MKAIPEKGRWLIAVSSGPDSMALLFMCLERGLELACAHVNYHHRDQAEEEEAYIREICAARKIPLYVRNEPFLSQGNFEADARQWRYEFFQRIVEEEHYDGVLIAHHQDDHLETYLMQTEKDLIPQTYGLAGMGEWHGMKVCRPLLDCTKQELEAYCRAHQIRYYIDATNASLEYARNRVRHTILKDMTEEDRQKLLAEIRRKNDGLFAMRRKAKQYLLHDTIDLDVYPTLDEEVRLCVLRLLLEPQPRDGASISRGFSREIDHILCSGEDFVIPVHEAQLVRENGRAFLYHPVQPYELCMENQTQLMQTEGEAFRIEKGVPGVNAVTIHEDDYPLTLRSFRDGDRIRMRYGTKNVARFFIDRHIPLYKRMTWPVLLNRHGEIILVPGLGCDINHYSVSPQVSVVQYSNSKGAIMNILEKDIDHVLFSEEEIVNRCKELGELLTKEYEGKKVLAVGLLNGVVPFMAELLKRIELDIQYDFMDVKSYEGTVSTGTVRILKDLSKSVEGLDVLLVEDIVDTGRSLKAVKEIIMERGAASCRIVSLLDKPARRVNDLVPDYVGYTVPDEFVVGFGLDYNQRYRCLPYVGVLKGECYK